MADNTVQTGTDTIATDDVTTLNGNASSGIKVQRVKVLFGDDNTGRDVSQNFPLPVSIAASSGNLSTTFGSLTASTAQTTGGTANTTSQIVAAVSVAGNATVTVAATAFVGTVYFELSDDGGTTYYTAAAAREDGVGADISVAINTASLFTRMWLIALPGVTHMRVRCGTFTSGTLGVRITPGPLLVEPNPIVTFSKPATPAITTVTATTSTGVVLAANPNRMGATIYSDTGATAYVAFGATATLTAYTVALSVGSYYELPFNYSGALSVITQSGTTTLRVTEVTS